MKYKPVLLIIGLLIVVAGIVMAAMTGVSVTAGTQSRWAGGATGNIITQAGNITNVNISGTVLTSKWADFYGNVSGTIVLSNGSISGSGVVYSWTYNTSGSAKGVCLTENSSWISSSAPVAATGANIDTVYGFTGTDADSGMNTYNTSSCSFVMDSGTINSCGNVTLKGNSTFNDCVIGNGGNTANNYGNLAFCTPINATGKNYINSSYNYEVMVPIQPPGTSGTYYFYAELS